MSINYIILAHKNPHQITRLVNRLNCSNCSFYIHVDKKVSQLPFSTALFGKKNVHFITKREDGKWGGIGIVKATLTALEQIVKSNSAGYCVLLSGQDYPIKSNDEISAVLEKNNGASFADVWAIPAAHWYNGGLDRIHYYKFDIKDGNRNYTMIPSLLSKEFYKRRRDHLKNILRLVTQFKIPFQVLRKRNFPKYLMPFGGSQWFAITTEMAERITRFLKERKDYVVYHRHTLLADEIFFQSLIMHFSRVEKVPVKPSLTYVRWEGKEAAHPVSFSSLHINELKMASKQYPEKLFARKFDFNDELFDVLDNL